MERDGQNFLSFRTFFWPFISLITGKIKILNIIILPKSTKNHDHMLCCSWDTTHDGCNCYFSFWAIFCPFTPITAWKMKISKKWKKMPGDIIILHKCTKNHNHMIYCSWDMERDRIFYFLLFRTIFWLFIPLKTQKIKILKKWKQPGDIVILHKCTKNHDHMLYCSWDNGVWWM